LHCSEQFAFPSPIFIAELSKFDAGAIGMDIQTALFGLVLWCTPSLLLLICLALRTPTGLDGDAYNPE